MNFSTQLFTFVFFLIFIAVYFSAHAFLKNRSSNVKYEYIIIIASSLIFYGFAAFRGVLFISVYSVIVFVMGKITEKIKKSGKTKLGKYIFTLFIVSLASVLFTYKYLPFSIEILKKYKNIDTVIKFDIIPIGISFITFSAISYLVDIYKYEENTGSFLETFTFITFFPKVISGPIVKWRDFHKNLATRKPTVNLFFMGMNRFIIGYAKKILFADYFATVISTIMATGFENIDTRTAWLCTIVYTFEIYFDFSGYSDIAIGISNMLGLEFKENFAFPYTSKSITEFWRRWHISLGSWFRDYIYIPLGGNRKGKIRTLINLGVVFLITGVWHGAGKAYLCWGLMHGFFAIFERIVKDFNWYKKIPDFVKWLFTMFVVNLGWVVFFIEEKDLRHYLGLLFGTNKNSMSDIYASFSYYLDKKLIVFLIIAFIMSILPFMKKVYALKDKVNSDRFIVVKETALLALMIISVIVKYNSSYSPFIYFQY